MNSYSLRLSLTLVKLVEVVGSIGNVHLLVAAGSWSIGIVVWVVGIGSSTIGKDRWLSLSFTLSKGVSSSCTITVGRSIRRSMVAITVCIIAIVVVGICWVAIVVPIQLSVSISISISSDSSSKAKEGNLKKKCIQIL